MRPFIIAGLILYIAGVLWMGINSIASIDYPLHMEISAPPTISGIGILVYLYGILL